MIIAYLFNISCYKYWECLYKQRQSHIVLTVTENCQWILVENTLKEQLLLVTQLNTAYLYIVDQWSIVVDCPPAHRFTPHSAAIKRPKSTRRSTWSIGINGLGRWCYSRHNCRSLRPLWCRWVCCKRFRSRITTNCLGWKIRGSRTVKAHPWLVTGNADLNGHLSSAARNNRQ